tara:strand:- start:2915 stop:3739 length:825 start_codon:yes stop_codon:yes gene_type:complete
MITTDLSNTDYHAHPAISKSGLDLISRSPAHYFYAAHREATRAMQLGTAIHAAILEPERFANQYMLLRDVTDRRASEYRQAVKVHGSEFTLAGPEADRVSGMQASVQANPRAMSRLGAPGKSEVSIITTDPETGVPVKCRFDWLCDDGRGLDLKKTQDIRADEFSRSVARYRYHVQAAFYSDVYKWETGEDLREFAILAVEESMPHANRVFLLDDEALQIGRMQYRADLNAYAECMNRGEWPGIVFEEDELLSLPMWAITQAEDEMIDSLEIEE